MYIRNVEFFFSRSSVITVHQGNNPTLLLPFPCHIPFYYSVVFSAITFNCIPFKIQFQFSCTTVPLTKIFRSIIVIVRRMCLNFQQ